MFPVECFRCVGVANVAAGAVARPTRPVVPAARVLRNIPADGSLIANLRRRCGFGGFRQDGESLADCSMTCDLGESRHCANLETAAGFANSTKFFNSAQVDDV